MTQSEAIKFLIKFQNLRFNLIYQINPQINSKNMVNQAQKSNYPSILIYPIIQPEGKIINNTTSSKVLMIKKVKDLPSKNLSPRLLLKKDMVYKLSEIIWVLQCIFFTYLGMEAATTEPLPQLFDKVTKEFNNFC